MIGEIADTPKSGQSSWMSKSRQTVNDPVKATSTKPSIPTKQNVDLCFSDDQALQPKLKPRK